jgi:hypothetical protein
MSAGRESSLRKNAMNVRCSEETTNGSGEPADHFKPGGRSGTARSLTTRQPARRMRCHAATGEELAGRSWQLSSEPADGERGVARYWPSSESSR